MFSNSILTTAPGIGREYIDDRRRSVAPPDFCADAEAPLAVVRGRYRSRLLIKSPRQFDLSHFIRGCLANAPKTRGSLKLEVDIDPQSFFDCGLFLRETC